MQNAFALLAAGSVISDIMSVVVAILILLLTITVHELGHYIVGKILKFKINEFAIGMGPALFKKTLKNGEIFSVRIFPLGGYCAFEGEDGAEDPRSSEIKTDGETAEGGNDSRVKSEVKAGGALSENAFSNKKPWQRILVLLAGATVNFIFALLLCSIKFTAYGHFELAPAEIIPSEINVGEALAEGDIITEINDNYVYLTNDYVELLDGKKKGEIVKLTVLRDGENKEVSVMLSEDVNCQGIGDIAPCLRAIGVGTVVTLNTEDGSAVRDGAYLFRFADFTDENDYSLNQRIYSLNDLYLRLKDLSAGEELAVWTYYEGDENRTLVTLRAPEDFDGVDKSSQKAVLGAFGIADAPAAVSVQVRSVAVSLGFFEALYRAPAYCFKTLWMTLRSFGELIGGKMAITELSGPIGTVSITSRLVSSWRFDYILEIASLIGLSVAIFNVLPIPALDGARVVFVIIEWIRKKPVSPKIEGTIHFVGLIALVIFAVLVDLLKIL